MSAERGTHYLELEDLLAVGRRVVVGELAVRDYGLLESALARPRTTVFGADAYPTLHEKAAAQLESLVRNHALIDGNKRLGWLATYVFLGLNGVTLEAPDDDAYDLVIAIAEGRSDVPAIAASLREWSSGP